jgi:hypothetical protein
MPDARPNPNQPHASVTVGAVAKTLTQLGYSFDALSQEFLIQSSGAIRAKSVGTPTSGAGFLLRPLEFYRFGRVELESMKLISADSANATLEIAAFIK